MAGLSPPTDPLYTVLYDPKKTVCEANRTTVTMAGLSLRQIPYILYDPKKTVCEANKN